MSRRNTDIGGRQCSAILEGLPARASAAYAAAYVRKLVRAVGPGFHPDERFAGYVSMVDGAPTFTVEECQRLEAALTRAWTILEAAGVDSYAVGLREQRRLLRRVGAA